MNIKLTIAMLFLAFSACPVQADWKSKLALGTGFMCLGTSYGFYSKAQGLQADLTRPNNSVNGLFALAQKREDLKVCRIAACLSFVVGVAVLAIPYLQQAGSTSAPQKSAQ